MQHYFTHTIKQLKRVRLLCFYIFCRDQNTKSKSSDLANARFARLKLNKYTYLRQVFANHAHTLFSLCLCVSVCACRESGGA